MINRIIAKASKGKYRDRDIEVIVGESSETSKVIVNGEVLRDVFGVHIHIRVDKPTTVVIEKYAMEAENDRRTDSLLE